MLKEIRLVLLALLFVLLLCAASTLCDANLLQEGDFENGGWTFFRSGGGWEPPEQNEWAIWAIDLLPALTGSGATGDYVASCDPADHAWMASTTVIPPGSYRVELNAACWGAPADDMLDVVIGGQLTELALIADGEWRTYEAFAVLSKLPEPVEIGFHGLGDNRVFVDDITVTHMPEPAGWLALGIGLAGLLRRKRK